MINMKNQFFLSLMLMHLCQKDGIVQMNFPIFFETGSLIWSIFPTPTLSPCQSWQRILLETLEKYGLTGESSGCQKVCEYFDTPLFSGLDGIMKSFDMVIAADFMQNMGTVQLDRDRVFKSL